MRSSTEYLSLDGVGPVLFVKSPRARRVSITVRGSRGVRVAVPMRVSFAAARRATEERLGWIRSALAAVERARAEQPEMVRSAECLDRRRARTQLVRRLAELAAAHGYAYNRVFVRNQASLWGSASAAGNINLNARLAVLPSDLSDYVILHELVHTRHRGHGRRFWRELESLVGDTRPLRKRLHRCALALL